MAYYSRKKQKYSILVTGASGYIGKEFLSHMTEYHCIGTVFKNKVCIDNHTFVKVDLRNAKAAKDVFKMYKPDIIYHFAALTSPQINEKEVELAKETHITLTQNILDNISTSTHLIFLSTDKVFDGAHPSPTEDTQTHPLWVYGELKLECEHMIKKTTKKYHIFRLPIVHSLGDPATNSFIDKALIQIKNHTPVEVYNNVFRCYVMISDLVILLKKSMNDMHYGIYHTGTPMMSYYDRLKKLCIDNNIKYNKLIQPTSGSVKPMKQNLDTEKIKSVFNMSFQ